MTAKARAELAKLDAAIAKTEAALNAVVQASIQEVIVEAQRSVSDGGRMRVDTGFLRASGKLSLDGPPSAVTRKPPEARTGQYGAPDVSLMVNGISVKNTTRVWFGWSAEYAAIREFYDGFLANAAQQWPSIVARNAKKAEGFLK